MFAIIKSGGKQYKVSKNQIVKLEKLAGEPGTEVKLNEVLLVGSDNKNIIVGSPVIQGAYVTAEIISQDRDAKVLIFKKQRRQHYRRCRGHRQSITYVKIKDIKAS